MAFLLGAQGQNPFPCLSPLLTGTHIPWLTAALPWDPCVYWLIFSKDSVPPAFVTLLGLPDNLG